MSAIEGQVILCSFCGLSQHEVVHMIAGPRVFICGACVWLCVDIIESKDAGNREYESWGKE